MGEWQIGTFERSNKAQTFSNLRNSCVSKDLVKGRIEYSCGQLCMYVQGSPVEIQTLNALEPDWPQRDRPAACAHQILLSPLSHCAFIPARNNLACF